MIELNENDVFGDAPAPVVPDPVPPLAQQDPEAGNITGIQPTAPVVPDPVPPLAQQDPEAGNITGIQQLQDPNHVPDPDPVVFQPGDSPDPDHVPDPDPVPPPFVLMRFVPTDAFELILQVLQPKLFGELPANCPLRSLTERGIHDYVVGCNGILNASNYRPNEFYFFLVAAPANEEAAAEDEEDEEALVYEWMKGGKVNDVKDKTGNTMAYWRRKNCIDAQGGSKTGFERIEYSLNENFKELPLLCKLVYDDKKRQRKHPTLLAAQAQLAAAQQADDDDDGDE